MNDEPYQVTERGDPRDRISNQRELFDVSRTVTTECEICGATRLPGHDKADGCWVDAQHAMGEYEKRPQACLNTWDPHAPLPEGY